MNDELNDFEIDILKALRKHNDRNTNKIFSMDEYYKNLHEDVSLNRFREKLILLEDKLYIKKMAMSFGEEFGSYDIAPEGIKYLINLEEEDILNIKIELGKNISLANEGMLTLDKTKKIFHETNGKMRNLLP